MIFIKIKRARELLIIIFNFIIFEFLNKSQFLIFKPKQSILKIKTLKIIYKIKN